MNYISSFIIVFMVIVGGNVNPLARTLAPIYEKELSREIKSINMESEGKWVALDGSHGGNFLYANGVKSVNGTHYYPDLELWKKLDKDTKYIDIYNRYAHVTIDIIDGDTNFELIAPDAIKVNLSIKDLDDIEIKYILSEHPLDKYDKILKKRYYNEIDKIHIYEYIG